MKFVALLLMFAFALPAHAKLVKKTIDYKDGKTTLEGYVVYDDATKAPRPGILVTHNWLGLTQHTKDRADQLAQLGYVAFAADIYGKGVRPKDQSEAGKQAGLYKGDRKLLRHRMELGLQALKDTHLADDQRLGVIGYCFGGTSALELALDGAPVKAVVTFHGGLDAPNPQDAKNIKGHVLVLHGADDPYNKAEDVAAFQKEMRDAKVDWQMVSYGNAVHSFTEKEAGTDNSVGAAYNALADQRSWQAMKDFLKETL